MNFLLCIVFFTFDTTCWFTVHVYNDILALCNFSPFYSWKQFRLISNSPRHSFVSRAIVWDIGIYPLLNSKNKTGANISRFTVFKYILQKWLTGSMRNINIDFVFLLHVYDTMKLNFVCILFRDTYYSVCSLYFIFNVDKFVHFLLCRLDLNRIRIFTRMR